MRTIPNPFREPLTPIGETDLELDAAIARDAGGPMLEAKLRRIRAGEKRVVRPKHKSLEEIEAEAAANIERDKALTEGLVAATKQAEAELYGFNEINEAEAKRLGLERVKVEGNHQAQELMARVFDQTKPNKFDVANPDEAISKAETTRFATEWERRVGKPGDKNYVPMPCVPGGYTGYIKALATNRIISNLETDPAKQKPSHPNFSKTRILYMVNDWEEQDYDQDTTLQTTHSALIRELGIKQTDGKTVEGVVNIPREQVDKALWVGDPSLKHQTPKHTELIKQLGLDPTKYNFRLISQDEYARLAGAGHNFGNSNLWTMFNDYWFVGGAAGGLYGGTRDLGGASDVRYGYRDSAGDGLAVRLVLECNK